MESVRNNLRYAWIKYLIALWMICTTAFVFHMDMRVRQLVTKVHNMAATMGSIQGVVSGSDYTLGNIEKKLSRLKNRYPSAAERSNV